MTTVAALFVATGGCYYGLDGVDPWDKERDARKYEGPWPVVAHPPCERWGRYWSGGPSARVRRELGDDGGCFAFALASVRQCGGVLEHPEASHAFAHHGLRKPHWCTGWEAADDGIGWVCCVAQGNYGHRARKLTWLYAAHVDLPALDWSVPEHPHRLDDGFHSAEERKAFRSNRTLSPEMMAKKAAWLNMVESRAGAKSFKRLSKTERAATPTAFRDVLIALARTARPGPVPPAK